MMAEDGYEWRRLIADGVLLQDAAQVRSGMDGDAAVVGPFEVEDLDEGDVVEAVVGVLHDTSHGQHRRKVHLVVADDGQDADVYVLAGVRHLLRRRGTIAEG